VTAVEWLAAPLMASADRAVRPPRSRSGTPPRSGGKIVWRCRRTDVSLGQRLDGIGTVCLRDGGVRQIDDHLIVSPVRKTNALKPGEILRCIDLDQRCYGGQRSAASLTPIGVGALGSHAVGGDGAVTTHNHGGQTKRPIKWRCRAPDANGWIASRVKSGSALSADRRPIGAARWRRTHHTGERRGNSGKNVWRHGM